jgi:hypothetical protein
MLKGGASKRGRGMRHGSAAGAAAIDPKIILWLKYINRRLIGAVPMTRSNGHHDKPPDRHGQLE